jgi:hypothetical protein
MTGTVFGVGCFHKFAAFRSSCLILPIFSPLTKAKP